MEHDSGQWDDYWEKQESTLLGLLAEFYRMLFLAGPLSRAFEEFFPRAGTFLEAGSGSAGDTRYIKKQSRKLIAFDYSEEALRRARQRPNVDDVVRGNLLDPKWQDNSLDGIWNLGVMEHFSSEEIDRILGGFHRALKDNGRLIMFWPANWNFVARVAPFLFPPMPSLLKSKQQARDILARNRFNTLAIGWTIMGDYIVVGEKTA